MSKSYSVVAILFFASNLKAGAIIKDNDTKQKIGVTYKEVNEFFYKGYLSNAIVTKSYRKDYGKDIYSIHPTQKKQKYNTEPYFEQISAKEFYSNPPCSISEDLKAHLKKYYDRVHQNISKRKRKLSFEQAQDIRLQYNNGTTISKLAEKYGVSTYPISQIINNRSYTSAND